MEKIYVLLRHDKQTGPYSLSELIQFDLKPYDLVWIQGKSAGWYYPQEIAALHPYLSFLSPKPVVTTAAMEKPVFVQPPAESEMPPTAPTAAPQPAPEVAWEAAKPVSAGLEEAVFAQFLKPATTPEGSYAPATSATPKQKSPHPGLVAFVAVLIVGGVFAASWLLNQGAVDETEATTLVTHTGAPNEINPAAVATDTYTTNRQTVAATGQQPVKRNNATKKPVLPLKNNPSVQKGTMHTAGVAGNEQTTASVKIEEAVQPEEAVPVPAETPSVPQEKKKSLRDKIVDLFRKKPAGPESEEQRVATRREGSASLAQLVHVRFDIPNNWMMGIIGAKATLVNRSNQKITAATVEVSYYNDDNELLQKKTVSFGKIDAKESKTISLPDHATATKVDYEIVSVTGVPAA